MKYRHLIVGAGRIGAGFNWHDDAYTHAGASQALRDRIELVGFVEPDTERALAAKAKWNVPVYENTFIGLEVLKPEVVSVCTQPDQQQSVLAECVGKVQGVWCEKPFMGGEYPFPIQVNYMRRADPTHRDLAWKLRPRHKEVKLVVYGKDDIHTRCHFEDLSKWWGVEMDYRPFNGPCAYAVGRMFFDQGGVDGGECFKGMLQNLLDHLDHNLTLWSPAYA